MNTCRVTIFGAGATGLGHLGLLLYQCGGVDLCFIEKNREIAERLKQRGAYQVRLLSLEGGPDQWITVQGVTALGPGDQEAQIKRLVESDLVLTAVIAHNLGEVAVTLAQAIAARSKAGIVSEMNIVCCENLDHASSLLQQQVHQLLSGEQRQYAQQYIGFPDCMISRVVPVPASDQLSLVTEDYNEWTVDRSGIRGSFPSLPCIEVVDNLSARLERKLWIHNGGHATLAYMAAGLGYRYVHEALRDPGVAGFTLKVLDEIGSCILHKYPEFDEPGIRQYQADLGKRGALEAMKDDISRVVRDPLRKLQPGDRLMAPAIYAASMGLPCPGLLQSINNAAGYFNPADPQSVEMRRIIKRDGLDSFFRHTLLGGAHDALADRLMAARPAASI